MNSCGWKLKAYSSLKLHCTWFSSTDLVNLLASYLLAGSTLEGPVASAALFTFGLSFCSTLTVTDEVQNHLHLLSEAQGFDFNDLRLAM